MRKKATPPPKPPQKDPPYTGEEIMFGAADEWLFRTGYAPGIVCLLRKLHQAQRATISKVVDLTEGQERKLSMLLQGDLAAIVAETYGLKTLTRLSHYAGDEAATRAPAPLPASKAGPPVEVQYSQVTGG